MIEVGSKVKDKVNGKIGTVIEITTIANGHSARLNYLIETPGESKYWRHGKDLMEYLTNDGGEYSGQFLTE